ncbi:MAG: 50S ribosomal protein L15 [Bacteroidales bacterium]|nr:50S ribosomal protein L15 [Bacteroidales bacterium]
MDLSNLKPAKGAVKTKKRLGRGEGSGFGDTASKGHKGAQSRSGYKRRSGFEGGQMPLYRRVPKYGFKNHFRKSYTVVNLATLQKLVDERSITSFDNQVFIENGLVGKNDNVKILGKGELNAKVDVKSDAFSGSAKKAIEEQGGTASLNE